MVSIDRLARRPGLSFFFLNAVLISIGRNINERDFFTMSFISQPVLPNDAGVILTIGFVCNGDRMACVLPLCTNIPSPPATTMCKDAVDSFNATVLAEFLACQTEDLGATFIQAEGMVDGKIPYRLELDPAFNVGTRPSHAVPNQASMLISFYEDPADVVAGHKMRVAKTFVPGLAADDFSTHIVASTVVALLNALGLTLQSGFSSVATPSDNWYRFLAAPKPRTAGTNVKRIATAQARAYVGTMKKRLIPR